MSERIEYVPDTEGGELQVGASPVPYSPQEHADLITKQGTGYTLEVLCLLSGHLHANPELVESRAELGWLMRTYKKLREWYRLGRQDTNRKQQEMDLEE